MLYPTAFCGECCFFSVRMHQRPSGLKTSQDFRIMVTLIETAEEKSACQDEHLHDLGGALKDDSC